MGQGGLGLAAEHAGDFLDAGFAFDLGEMGDGAVAGVLLGDDELGRGGGGDLREMGDAEDLVGSAEAPHFCADGMGDLAADIGVDFVEDEQGNAVLGREGAFDGEHDAGDFAAGGDELEGLGGLAGIRGEEELGGFAAEGGRFFGGMKGDGEFGFLEAEVAQLALDAGGQFGCGGGAEFREFCAESGQGFAGGGDGVVKAGDLFAAGFDAVEARGGLFAKGDDFVERGTVFAFEGLEEGDALLEGSDLRGVDFKGAGVMLEGAGDFLEFDDGVGLGLGERRGGGVEFFEVAEVALDFGEAGEEGILGLGEALEDGGGEVDEAAAVRGDGIPGEGGFFFAGLEGGGLDLGDLVAEEIEFALEGGFAGGEARVLGQELGEGGELDGVCSPGGAGAGVGVEEVELFIVGEEGLVIVRAV